MHVNPGVGANRPSVVVGAGGPVIEVKQHGQVKFALPEANDTLVGLAVGEGNRDAWVACAERLQRSRGKGDRGGGEGPDP